MEGGEGLLLGPGQDPEQGTSACGIPYGAAWCMDVLSVLFSFKQE